MRGAPKNSYRSPRLRVIYWAGAGIFSVTIVTFIISLAPILANATEGLVRVDESLIYPFLKYKGTPAQILFRLRLPNSHFGRHQCPWRHCWSLICGANAGRRGRAGLCDNLRE